MITISHADDTDNGNNNNNNNNDNNDQTWSPDVSYSLFPDVKNILQFEDSSNTLLLDIEGIYITTDSGKNWNKIDLKDENGNDLIPISIQEFEFQKSTAIVFTSNGQMFRTTDQAETWESYTFPIDGDYKILSGNAQINYVNPDYMLFSLKYFDNGMIIERTFFTKDNLKTDAIDIDVENAGECTFTKINPDFNQGDDSTIICIRREYNQFGLLKEDQVISTSDFFENIIVTSGKGLENSHVLKVKIVKSFAILVVSTDRYLTDSTVLYTSKDGISFTKTFFEGQEKGWMFSILDSTPNALYVSVYGRNSKHMIGSADIFRSDSDGKYFKKIFGDVFSNMLGMSLISKVETLDGVWIASHNSEYHGMQNPDSKTMITYDDGENWSYLNITDSENCSNDEECSLNIAWLTQRAGDGEIVSGETPGIILGVGNVGKYLEHNVDNLKTFLSRDGGLTWKKVSDSPTVFAYGDLGNILITVPVNLSYFLTGNTDKAADSFSYSLDQGETWSEVKLSSKVVPLFFVNSSDNTDKSFILYSKEIEKNQSLINAFDFTNAYSDTCTDNDMEEWYARVDPISGEQVCVYGHSEKFNRRKIDAKCFVNKNYADLVVIEQPCTCTIDDSECNSGFRLDENNICQPILSLLSEFCDSPKGKTKISSRRIKPGNLCQGGYQPPVDDYKLNCNDANDGKEQDAITVRYISFKENIRYYQYLDKNSSQIEFQDETLIVLTASRKAYVSFDEERFFTITQKPILYIFTNPFWQDSVYLLTDSGEMFASKTRAYSFDNHVLPHTSSGYSSYNMEFDIRSPDVHILLSHVNCDAMNNCENFASLTEDNGNSYVDLPNDITHCIFAESLFDTELYDFPDTEIICAQKVEGQDYSRLISTTDAFLSDTTVLFDKIVGFTTSGKYLVVAELADDSLVAHVSVDGKNFARIQFPVDINVERQTAYTILDVKSKELFFHLTTYDEKDHEFGALLKANYNGTLLTTAIDYVNRNDDAFIDFESVQSLEGLSIVNVVSNPDEVKDGGDKKLVSKISHNDAATWFLLPPPLKDSNGKSINCKGCSLHLHSYTERLDPSRDTFSSTSAIGMLFGLGNVGTSLSPLNPTSDNSDVALYFSKDAGITWKEIVKGNWIWEYGDQGTILVIVQRFVEVNTLKFSLDLGETWSDYIFSPEKKYLVEDIATVPSDNSLKFIIIVKDEDVSNSIFTVDFTSVYPRQCELPLDTKEAIGEDYEYFIPKHPSVKSNCLFGHETKYLRRKAKKSCFVGMTPLNIGTSVVNNCECSREDYECDYNFELSIDGTCKLVKGLESKRGDEICFTSDADEWWQPTGYRKLEQSTCDGGLLLDKWVVHPCPGKSLNKGGISGFSMFWVIFIPLIAFASSLVVVYERGIKRNGGFSRLGEIRLDEDDNLQLIEENKFDKIINTVVRFGVFTYQIAGKLIRFSSKFVKKITGRNQQENMGSMGAFFNDMVDDDHSLFGDLNDDEDAREIDSFLERGNNDDFGDFATHDGNGYHDDDNDDFLAGEVDQHPVDADNSEFRLSDDNDDI
ncbi:vacuolar protein sorting/targeting protein PEP1 [Pichia californica]|uniref:Vacuolar protein sorting/targeting protein PEP1 n=1 Tax=Pichia californica TaxID=460514 RepID=A0A9P7BDS3_9ASCO|nr:vacuolar protein sorting/targeting protein PEP1 [[Candida] californica]KAG0687166.1 vacuolar protein sorting/targeting protein PEP1 [[Candida] californica]